MAIGAGAIMGAVGGLAGIAGGIIGGGKRRREQRAAQEEMQRAKTRMMNLDTSNLAANMENPYEDLTVNQKQAQFMAQQTHQGLANQMQALRGAAGASGISGLAQAIANQRTRNLQGISGAIGQQEAQNERLKAQGALQTKLAKAQGEQQMEMFQAQKAGTMLGMSQANVAGATMQQQAALGGVAHSIGSLGGAIEGHVEQQKLKTDLDNTTLVVDETGSASGGGSGPGTTSASKTAFYGTPDYNPIEAVIKANPASYGYNTELNKPLPREDGLIINNGGLGNYTTGGLLGGNTSGSLLGNTHKFATGDTLWSIAKANGMTVAQLLALNTDITDPNNISLGKQIQLK